MMMMMMMMMILGDRGKERMTCCIAVRQARGLVWYHGDVIWRMVPGAA